MRLSWRDGIATGLGVFAIFVYRAVTESWGWALLGSYRSGTLVLAGVGLAMCIVGGQLVTPTKTDPMLNLGWLLGSMAFVVTLIGVIAPSKGAFELLAIDVAVLWGVATIRHTLAIPSSGRGLQAR